MDWGRGVWKSLIKPWGIGWRHFVCIDPLRDQKPAHVHNIISSIGQEVSSGQEDIAKYPRR